MIEFICRLVGHKPKQDRDVWYCGRCSDILPEGNKRRQP